MFQGYQGGARGRGKIRRHPKGIRQSRQKTNWRNFNPFIHNVDNQPSTSSGMGGYFTGKNKFKKDVAKYTIKNENDCMRNVDLNDENKNKKDFRYLFYSVTTSLA